MAETAAQKRAREAREAKAASTEQAADTPTEGDEQAASPAEGDAQAPETAESTQGADDASEAPSGAQGPAGGDAELVPRRYVALRSMGGVTRGKEFDALPSDPRVKSGYAKLVGAPELPAAVAEALDGVDSPAS